MGNARTFVEEALRNCLPPGVPPSFREVLSAHRVGTGRRMKVEAELMMFDGRRASVEVWQSGGLTAHRFTEMPGGAASYERGKWVRRPEDAPIPIQPDLFGAHANG